MMDVKRLLKRFLMFSFLLTIMANLCSFAYAQLPECGGDVPCGCGYELTASRVFNESDTLSNCGLNGLHIFGDDIILDCAGQEIRGTGSGNGIIIDGYSNIKILNCKIVNFSTGLYAEDARNLTVQDSSFVWNGREVLDLSGIHFNNVNYSNIINSNFSQNDYGIVFVNSNNNTLSGNIVNESLYSGVYFISSNYNTISGGLIINNNIYESSNPDETEAGIRISADSKSNYITGVEMYNNKVGGAVYLQESDGNTIDGNNIHDNCGDIRQIYVLASDNTLIKNNNITSGTGKGIEIKYSSGAQVLNNNISNNNQQGVYIYNLGAKSNHLISGNDINNNNHYGIWLYGEENVTISNNNIINNWNGGVYVDSSFDVKTLGNTIDSLNNSYYGIYYYYSSNGDISGNTVSNTIYSSIYIFGDSGLPFSYHKIRNNTIKNGAVDCSSGCGAIELVSEDNNLISGNIITDSGYNGISLYDSYENDILNNTITNVYNMGIRLASGGEGYGGSNIVSGNAISNSCVGIRIGTQSNTISENIITGQFECDYWGPTRGVFLGSSRASSESNEFYGNKISGYYYGFYISSINNVFAEGDEYYNNYYGVYLVESGGETPEFNDVNIHDNCEGMQMWSSSAYLFNCSFTNNSPSLHDFCSYTLPRTGLYILNSQAYIDGGRFINNGPYGIYADSNSYVNFYEDRYQGQCSNNALNLNGIHNVDGTIEKSRCPILPEEAEFECGDLISDDITLKHPIDCSGHEYNAGLEVNSGNITIDCDGWSLIGYNSYGSGVLINGFNGVTIKNCDITRFGYGVSIKDASYVNVQNNQIYSNAYAGVDSRSIEGQNQNINVIGNKLFENYYGIHLDKNHNGLIVGNNINVQPLGYGISIVGSEGIGSYNTISQNTIKVSDQGMGIEVLNDDNNNITKNVIECNSYLMTTGIYLTGSEAYGNTFFGNEIFGCYHGFEAFNVENFTFTGKIHDNYLGMNIYSVGGEGSIPSVINSLIYNNCEGALIGLGAGINIIETNFTNNNPSYLEFCGGDTGLYVGIDSHVNLVNGNFVNNGNYGIIDQSLASLYWLITKNVMCYNNSIRISNGFIMPFGGRILKDDTCTITFWNGEEWEEFTDTTTGVYREVIITEENPENPGDYYYTVGKPDYGIVGEIHADDKYSGEITIRFYNEAPEGKEKFKLGELGIWVDVAVTGEIADNLDYWILKIYYKDEQVAAAGLDESSLRITYYNPGTGEWEAFAEGGVDTTNNYVWAKITHFSLFGIGGSAPSSGVSSGGGGGGYVSNNLGVIGATPRTFTLMLNKEFLFTIKEQHAIMLTSIDLSSRKATFRVASNPIQFTIEEQKSGDVDLNADGTNDLRIGVVKLTASNAVVTLQAISEVLAKEQEQPSQQPPVKTIPLTATTPEKTEEEKEPTAPQLQRKDKTSLAFLIITLALIALIVGYILVPKKKHHQG